MSPPVVSSVTESGVPRLAANGYTITAYGHYTLAVFDPARGVVRIPPLEMRSVTRTTSRHFTSLRTVLHGKLDFVEEISNPFTGESVEGRDMLVMALDSGLSRLLSLTKARATRLRWYKVSVELAGGDVVSFLAALSALGRSVVCSVVGDKELRELARHYKGLVADLFEDRLGPVRTPVPAGEFDSAPFFEGDIGEDLLVAIVHNLDKAVI